MSEGNKKYDLEERLIQFALLIIDIVEMLPNTRAGQLIRSGTSPAFNYGEAQVAESRDDFIHKMKICLKELKEAHIAVQIIQRKPLIKDFTKIDKGITECKELISIFLRSIETARKNETCPRENGDRQKILKHFPIFMRTSFIFCYMLFIKIKLLNIYFLKNITFAFSASLR